MIDNMATHLEEVQVFMTKISPNIVCVAQEWDNRIDCFVKLPDGRAVGEMIPLASATSDYLAGVGDRLLRRLAGEKGFTNNEVTGGRPIVRRGSTP